MVKIQTELKLNFNNHSSEILPTRNPALHPKQRANLYPDQTSNQQGWLGF